MKILTVFTLVLTICLLMVTAQIYHELTAHDMIMMGMICFTSLVGCLVSGFIALNSEE